ncbi:hypothetical protein BDY21DRAFT_365575 [Lineolata rhizophorae]|uniref:Uncharacterized protein n=1 Tax=Lineolata rhizophorae TaxID=578093 RepID=A0A6A6NUW7_9PEZI|nr:hypothetical protein BDY21DRAFT_365575 [Lineolata rhizophorae]
MSRRIDSASASDSGRDADISPSAGPASESYLDSDDDAETELNGEFANHWSGHGMGNGTELDTRDVLLDPYLTPIHGLITSEENFAMHIQDLYTILHAYRADDTGQMIQRHNMA